MDIFYRKEDKYIVTMAYFSEVFEIGLLKGKTVSEIIINLPVNIF